MILLLVLVTGFATVLSTALSFDSYTEAVSDCQTRYESQYGVKFSLTQEEYEALTEALPGVKLYINIAESGSAEMLLPLESFVVNGGSK